jgi:excisionase family DNA binding protein
MSSDLEVWLDCDLCPRQRLGTLSHDRGQVRFHYDKLWLAQQDIAFAIDPQLTLDAGPLFPKPEAGMLKVLSEVESPDFDIQTLSIFTGPYALTVAERDEMLTSEEAAKLLNVSRTHMAKLIDAGLIAGAEKTEGRHRRVPKAAVLAYKKASRVNQAKGFTRMFVATERMGLYDAELARARKRA